MIDHDLVAIIGQLGDVLADVVGKRDAPVIDKEECCSSDKLLHQGSGIEDRFRTDWNATLKVRRAVSAVHDHVAVKRGHARAPGRSPDEDLVDLKGLVLCVGWRAGKQGRDRERW